MLLLSKRQIAALGQRALKYRPHFSSELLLALGALLGACWGYWGFNLGAALGVGAWLIILPSIRERSYFAVGLGMVALAAWCQNSLPSEHFSRQLKLPAQVEVELKINDTRLSAVSGLTPPRNLSAEVLRFNGQTSGGALRVKFPESSPPLRYGDIYRVKGTISLPEFLFKRASGDFEEPRFKVPFLRVEDARFLRNEPGMLGNLLHVREYLIARLLHQIDAPGVRNMAASFCFGASGGLNRSSRADFLASGTVHLFSISGMHVGLLAMILLLFLKPWRFRYRYWVLTALLGLYVVMTGCGVPALRAWGMIGLFAILRSLLFYTPPIRTLAVAGAGILLVLPNSVGSIGFWFSFLITAGLLLAGEQLRYWRPVAQEVLNWMPYSAISRRTQRQLRRREKGAGLIYVTLTAFFAGAGVTLYFQNQLLPGSVAANLLLPLLMPLILVCVPLKMTIGAISLGADAILAGGIELFFHSISAVAGMGAELFGVTGTPAVSLGVIVLYYVVFFAVWSHPQSRWSWYGGGFLVLFLLIQPLRQLERPPEVTVISGDATVPGCVMVTEPERHLAFLINPTYEAAWPAITLLHEKGFMKLSGIGFSEPRRNHAAGIGLVNFYLPPEAIYIPELSGRQWSFRKLINARLPESQVFKVAKNPGFFQIFPQKSGYRLDYCHPGSMLKFTIILDHGDTGRQITLLQNRQILARAVLPWSSLPGEWKYEFR